MEAAADEGTGIGRVLETAGVEHVGFCESFDYSIHNNSYFCIIACAVRMNTGIQAFVDVDFLIDLLYPKRLLK